MSLKIRLARGGAKKDAHYRVVVIDSRKARDGRAVEVIGHYHPNFHDNDKRFVVDVEKLNKWLSYGALPTEVITRMCVSNGIANMDKYKKDHSKVRNVGKSKKEIKAENSGK